jgi:peroxiredoxin
MHYKPQHILQGNIVPEVSSACCSHQSRKCLDSFQGRRSMTVLSMAEDWAESQQQYLAM